MPQATRRTVLQAATWTPPVVALTSAAPAFAVSGSAGVTFVPGASSVVTDGEFFGVQFKGASLVVGSDAVVAPTGVTLAVTFVPVSGGDKLYSDLTAPASWTVVPRGTTGRNVVTFRHGNVTASGASIPLSNGIYFGTDDVDQRGTFVLAFTVGALVAHWSAATP
ncbi:hypothetical protein [Nocardioides yefusunii]|uniref:Htaa domain-containing protein n=1 Tax=Nocardioides yefusunii TaxID=2500546 RepID=A0ABW1QSH6_9ACTN|nr:hypothetical protein [Nocardioides yefusunii]